MQRMQTFHSDPERYTMVIRNFHGDHKKSVLESKGGQWAYVLPLLGRTLPMFLAGAGFSENAAMQQ
ncbi:hypothetical protein [Acidithiobacillus ferriphilus]|uniref:hypothetical protein n=1 Tax=Acidithiobacillus ferriphilus TaxID=1689834 RepID=UPI001C0708B8|nr:hypothetical protein [Acidithiobacillus ferriphilus]MBU2828695.1 hypothetical protein [Acidithiobacillus ferriphilus]